MPRGPRAAGAMVVVLVLVALLSASARATVVSLGSDPESYTPPRVVVDAIGVGYTSWADGGSGQSLDICRLAPHASACEARHAFAFPGVGTSVDGGNAPVLTAGGPAGGPRQPLLFGVEPEGAVDLRRSGHDV